MRDIAEGTMAVLQLGDIAMAYDDFGELGVDDAAPILLLHGAVQTKAVWSGQVDALSTKRRVIIPDLRGHGETSLGNLPMSIEQMAKDCTALLDALDISRVAVCGISLGGMVALEMAEHSAERVTRIVLSNTPMALSSRRWVRRLIDWIDPHRLLRPTFALLGQARSARIGLAAATAVVGPHWVGTSARRHFIGGFASMSEDAIVATYRTIVESRPADLNAVRCPCLVIEGRSDAATVKDQSWDIRNEGSNVRLAQLDVGHVANLDDPEGFNRLLVGFLEEHD